MPLYDLIVLRENATFDRLNRVGVLPRLMHVKPDPAFLLQPADSVQLSVMLKQEGLEKVTGPMIGMIAGQGSHIFDHCFSAIKDRSEKYRHHRDLFSALVEQVIEITHGTVIFLPHCIGYESNRDDRIVARDVRSAVRKEMRESIILIENEYDAATLKALIKRLDFLVAERTHALIGACSVGTPFIALTVKEDTRTHGIIGDTFGMPDLLLDINEPDINVIMSRFEEKWNSREKIKQQLLKTAAIVHQECRSAAKMLAAVIKR
jgi:polysaccharide pyruvyl transferase WcaK-like protein